MKKILSILLVAVMMLSVLSLTVAADTTYSVATDGDGNPLNPYFVNSNVWTETDGALKPAQGDTETFLLFDDALTANKIEATFKDVPLNGDGDTRNGIVFALKDNDRDGNFVWGTDVSYYWAFISGWDGRIGVLKMGEHNGWTMLSAGGDWSVTGPTLNELGIDPAGSVTLAAEWDNEGHIKVFANGTLVHEITDTTGTPLTGNLYGLFMRNWSNSADGGYSLSCNVSSFVAGKATKPETGDTTVIVSLIALVAAMGTGIVIGKKRSFN